MADLEGARKKIDKILLNWFIDDPILLSTACMLNREPDPKQETWELMSELKFLH